MRVGSGLQRGNSFYMPADIPGKGGGALEQRNISSGLKEHSKLQVSCRQAIFAKFYQLHFKEKDSLHLCGTKKGSEEER